MEPDELQGKISGILQSIGLTKNEITLYLDLVKNVNSSALDISKRTRIHRSNTYDSLRNLLEKGFATEALNEGRRSFSAIDPSKIRDFIRQKEQEFDFILPKLKEITSENNSRGAISMGQGSFALREAASDLLKLNSPIVTYGASQETVDSFGEGFLRDFHKERIKNKIEMRHIYNKSAIERVKFLNKIKYTEAKYLPEKYDTSACTTICKDVVLIYIFSKPILVISIVNSEVANAYRNYFELMWKMGKSE